MRFTVVGVVNGDVGQSQETGDVVLSHPTDGLARGVAFFRHRYQQSGRHWTDPTITSFVKEDQLLHDKHQKKMRATHHSHHHHHHGARVRLISNELRKCSTAKDGRFVSVAGTIAPAAWLSLHPLCEDRPLLLRFRHHRSTTESERQKKKLKKWKRQWKD